MGSECAAVCGPLRRADHPRHHTVARAQGLPPRGPLRPASAGRTRARAAPHLTELANAEVSVYTLMKLLGHESVATSQRYVAGAARETHTAAAQNPLYDVIRDRPHQREKLDGDSDQ
jgi:hypothetical protein